VNKVRALVCAEDRRFSVIVTQIIRWEEGGYFRPDHRIGGAEYMFKFSDRRDTFVQMIKWE
jgi:hypothetical protein